MNWIKKTLVLLITFLVVMVTVSCTTERSAVDKTDEQALDKRLFEGEFFLRQTIVDLPYSADYAFIGESNDGKIVKWKITENWLIAYSIWDNLTSIDTNEIVDVNETPIVAYPIAAHYDIVPTENPTTGEALPVLTQNMDRPWNERRYFSLVTNSLSGVSNRELKYLNLTIEWGAPFYKAGLTTATDWEFYAHDGTFIVPKKYRDYTSIADEKERYDKEVEWFQFFSTEYFEPINDWSILYNWDDINEFASNEPAAVTYRFTFSKVNRDVVGKRDYDLATRTFSWKKGKNDNGFRPLEYPDELFREYGYFTSFFRGYDNYHGYRDDNYHELANYWNIAWANSDKQWNFTCGDETDYNKCLKQIKYQQKIIFTSSPKTPLRMLPANCAIAKDYNYAMLASRYAAMNPGSDTRNFEQWYMANYKNDFFKEVEAPDGSKVKVRDMRWYVSDLNDPANPHHNWKEKCFVPDKYAKIQNWDGSFIDEGDDPIATDEILQQYVNDIVVLVENPVESYVPARDGKALYGFGNYYNYSSDNTENAVKICVKPEEASLYSEDKVMHFSTCVTNEENMSTLYVNAGAAEWRGDRWDCKIYKEDEKCPEGYKSAKAACVLTEERSCEVEDGLPVLRHKYDNGNNTAALINWVDKPTEYGILGVSQWNINPETGMTLAGGSNIAGSVLAWSTSRAIELARVIISDDDPAAWDWKDLINPDYAETPTVIWDNDPVVSTKSAAAPTRSYNKNNLMTMVSDNKNLNYSGTTEEDLLWKINQEYTKKTTNYNRFDFTTIIGNPKWEGKMVPYSIKKNLFPWLNPSDNPIYTDAQKEMMQPWFAGPAAMEAQIIRYLDAKALDFDFDESFMDGAILQFIKEKQDALREETPNWDENSKTRQKYEDSLIYAIYNELEKLQYKAVAEHEMGHTLGLRHNFAGSTDINNYIDEYFATRNYPTMIKGIEDLLRTEQDKENYDPATFGIKAYRYKKAFADDLNFYAYTSIMDYQREAYIHAVGPGKYDLAALKFVYGRSFEQVKIVDDAQYGRLLHQGQDGDEGWVNPLRDPKYPDYVRTNEPYLNSKGKLLKVSIPTQIYTYYEKGKKVETLAPKIKRNLMGKIAMGEHGGDAYDYDCDEKTPECTSNTTYLVNDGRHYEYIFVSDEKSQDDPKANTFDGGYTASDIIRGMADMDNSFYFLRYFRRGNPKFREFRGRTSMKMIYDTLFEKYKYIHFMLDFNFYIYEKWAPYVLICEPTFDIPVDESSANRKTVDNYICEEYHRALKGEEYWFDDETGELRTLTPMGPADHIIAGMEGVNYFYYNVLYRPAVGSYVKIQNNMDADLEDKLEKGQTEYYQTSENFISGYDEIYESINVPPRFGRFQKDRYDIQDNPSIYYDEVLRRGYAEEKMVAIYAIANAGWFDAKYRRESRANSIDQQFEGLENVKFNMLSDIANEEALFSFSPYCVKGNQIVRVDLPVNLLANWAAQPPFPEISEEGVETNYAYSPHKNICARANLNGEGGYLPIHAGWTYFDKMWPMYWAMGNVMNTSADTSVLQRFITFTIPEYKINEYPEPDVNEAQFLNKDGNTYYRAVLAQSTLDVQDQASLVKWKECRKERIDSGEEYESCIEKVVYTEVGAAAANAANAEKEKNTEAGAAVANNDANNDANDDANSKKREPVKAGDQRFEKSEQFREYLADKYSRYSPSFRLVLSAGRLKQSEIDEIETGAEGWSRLVIMETTLDQMNSFARDNLGISVIYASYY